MTYRPLYIFTYIDMYFLTRGSQKPIKQTQISLSEEKFVCEKTNCDWIIVLSSFGFVNYVLNFKGYIFALMCKLKVGA